MDFYDHLYYNLIKLKRNKVNILEKVTYYSKINGIALEQMVRQGKFDMRVNHFHNEYEIFFLVEGERHFFFNNRAYLAVGGDLILVDSNRIHMTRAATALEEGHDRIILYIDRAKMEEFDQKYPHLNLVRFFHEHYGVFKLTLTQQQQFLTLYHSLQQEMRQQNRNYKNLIELEIISYFIHFMREAHEVSPVQDQQGLSKSSRYRTVYTIADYISEHFYEPITLECLAKQFYLSKYYLSRTFKEITGHGVNEYVNILRTKQAKRLLEETNLNVSDIAAAIGYSSITYFEKVFKMYMTMPPLKYRKTLDIVTYTNVLTPSDPTR
jgi:AraC-like DNA-binding protein